MREPPLIDRQRAMKHFMVWTLGLALLVGSPALSFALQQKDPVVNCKRISVDRFLCVINGKEYLCPSEQKTPKGCTVHITQPPGGVGVPKGVTPPGGTLQK